MLGKLAKWLRVMGYDTHYQTYYQDAEIVRLVKEKRLILSRRREITDRFSDALLIRSNIVGEQIQEMRTEIGLNPERSRWFTRCSICNIPLRKAEMDRTRDEVPEYIFYQKMNEIRFCAGCGRYFWPGSHRQNMKKQLEHWGFE